jgi:hypothetical protein
MSVQARKVDAKCRVILPEGFAGRTVLVEQVGEAEVRIRLAKHPRPRPSLHELLSRVTDDNLPEKVEFGPPIGEELL